MELVQLGLALVYVLTGLGAGLGAGLGLEAEPGLEAGQRNPCCPGPEAGPEEVTGDLSHTYTRLPGSALCNPALMFLTVDGHRFCVDASRLWAQQLISQLETEKGVEGDPKLGVPECWCVNVGPPSPSPSPPGTTEAQGSSKITTIIIAVSITVIGLIIVIYQKFRSHKEKKATKSKPKKQQKVSKAERKAQTEEARALRDPPQGNTEPPPPCPV